MIEPRRLREECESPFERALLEAGSGYRSSAAARTKTLAALGLAGSAALSASAISVSSSAVVAKLGGAKLLSAVSVVGALAVPAGYYTWHRYRGAPSAAESNVRAATVPDTKAAAKVVAAVASEPSNAAQAPADSNGDAQTAAAADTAANVHAPRLDAKSAAPNVGLTAELNALDAARSALAAGNALSALSLLDAYAHTYPHGRLGVEAEVLRIDALAKSGQSDAAKKRAEAFLRRYPNSVLASRVRGYLNE
jgi:hypothetical protein